jgi:hypothetical protein
MNGFVATGYSSTSYAEHPSRATLSSLNNPKKLGPIGTHVQSFAPSKLLSSLTATCACSEFERGQSLQIIHDSGFLGFGSQDLTVYCIEQPSSVWNCLGPEKAAHLSRECSYTP